ncbi:DUF924 family protein [Catenovulum sediminis]|uniref:DUF924 family protein n=1 Tax=Catenovulum sediminis TaxID=1740262 RepID=A0ABV1RH85_9ALTE|nr:DUF924 family protein [Catenovulum sediminis]
MYQEIIEFWFSEIDKSKWFTKDPEFDQLIYARFAGIHQQAVQCELYGWRCEALGCLAEIIILDQFSRNMYRDSAQSFAYDSLALALAQSAIAAGKDSALTVEQRSFLYMPFMHSESLAIHQVAVDLYQKLGAARNLEFELKHQKIIEKFGRYPHRNEILGRQSTAQEIEFLNQPGSRF